MTEFGFTPENVAARARALLATGRHSMTSAIARLNDFGQSPWYDNLARPLLTGGGLAQLVTDDGIRGVTSNPTILDKAIDAGEGYDEQLAACAKAGLSIEDTYWAVVARRHQGRHRRAAAGPRRGSTAPTASCRSRCRRSSRTTPTARSRMAAVAVRARVDRPNVMIKIPATLEGVPAIEEIDRRRAST